MAWGKPVDVFVISCLGETSSTDLVNGKGIGPGSAYNIDKYKKSHLKTSTTKQLMQVVDDLFA